MNEETKPAAIEAYYAGDKPIVSRGGYVVQMVIPFEDADTWRTIAGNWSPDNPVTFALARLGKATKVFDPKTKEWLLPE